MKRSHWSPVMVVASKLALTPALLTRTVAGPNVVVQVAAIAATSASTLTSASTNLAWSPTLLCTASPSSGSRSQNTTLAPLATNTSTIACPMPRAPPVTIAISPSSDVLSDMVPSATVVRL